MKGTVRERIVAAGARILAESGRDALTTRAVSEAAGVQAPTLYRLFGDKDGLLEAVAEDVFTRYLARKRSVAPKSDPLEDLRLGWDMTIQFGLEHPAVFSILYSDRRPDSLARLAAGGAEVLRTRIRKVAAAGLLRVSEDRAVSLIRAGGSGTVLMLLSVPEDQRDPELSVAAREAMIAAITNARPTVRNAGSSGAAIALKASLDENAPLTPGERQLLTELLDRLASAR